MFYTELRKLRINYERIKKANKDKKTSIPKQAQRLTDISMLHDLVIRLNSFEENSKNGEIFDEVGIE